jgi:MFS superfamily sulfate permease-like transporter
MLAILVGVERFPPKAPAPLIAVAIGIAASGGFGRAHGWLPSATFPKDFRPSRCPSLGCGTTLAGALHRADGFTETIAAGRLARSNGPRPKPNQELLATGLANVGGGLFGGSLRGGTSRQR